MNDDYKIMIHQLVTGNYTPVIDTECLAGLVQD